MTSPSVERIEQLMTEFARISQREPEAWRELDLTMTQLKALMFLQVRQSLSIGRLGEAVGISLASASGLVDRLVRLGLVSRHEDPADRRQNLVHLSEAGEALLGRIEGQISARLQRIIQAMSPAGREALERALEEMIRCAQADAAARPAGASARVSPASRGSLG